MPIETFTKAGKKRLRWTFERVIAGQRIRKTKTLPIGISQGDADKLAAKWEAEIYKIAEGTQKARATIGECVEIHFRDKGSGWKDLEKRTKVMEKWRPLYHDRYTDELHKWSLDFGKALRAEGLTDGSIRNVMAYIRAAIKWAYKVEHIAEDQTRRMVIPQVNNARHIYPQRRDMLRIAMECEDRQVRAAIRIAFYSGMRRSEILRAKVTKKGFSLSKTKNGLPRIVPVHPKIAVLARKVRFTIDGDHFAWHYEKARKRAGLEHLRFHDLRHGAASEMINQDVDLYTVGAVLGHKDAKSTARYAHLVTNKLAQAVGRIGKKTHT